MSAIDRVKELLAAANDNERPCDCERIRWGMFAGEHTRECAVFIWQDARAVARRTLKDSAHAIAEELVELAVHIDLHDRDCCQQLARMDGLEEAMEG